jgi:glutamate dehydrogenase
MNCAHPLDITQNIEAYGPGVRETISSLDEVITEADHEYLQQRARGFIEAGAPEPLARRVAALRLLVSACDIVKGARAANASVPTAAQVYFTIGSRLNIDWLRRQAAGLTTESHWESQAVNAIIDDLYSHQYQLALKMLRLADGKVSDAAGLIRRWCERRGAGCVATTQVIHEIHGTGGADLAMLAVANRHLRALAAD